jgi:hypothetical protein
LFSTKSEGQPDFSPYQIFTTTHVKRLPVRSTTNLEKEGGIGRESGFEMFWLFLPRKEEK